MNYFDRMVAERAYYKYLAGHEDTLQNWYDAAKEQRALIRIAYGLKGQTR